MPPETPASSEPTPTPPPLPPQPPSPPHAPQGKPASLPDYYQTDSRRISLREFWNIEPTWKVLIPWLLGRLNIRMPPGSGFQMPEHVREIEVAESALSEEARSSLAPRIEECLALGFHSPRHYELHTLRRDVCVSFASMPRCCSSSASCRIRNLAATAA
jgi:hypothetical protein